MILVDKRAGSKDLVVPLQARGLPVEETILEFGDLAWTTSTKAGRVLQVGVEFKTLQDAVNSLREGRLSGHQAPGMLGPEGQYDIGIILIEGEWANSPHGELLEREHGKWKPVRGSMSTQEFHKRLFTLSFVGGFHVLFTTDRQNSLDLLLCLYRWFTDKPMDSHQSHFQEHSVEGGIVPISDFRAILKRFPGIGFKASGVAEKKFGNLKRACNATVDEWATIATDKKKLGLKIASRIVAFIKGEA